MIQLSKHQEDLAINLIFFFSSFTESILNQFQQSQVEGGRKGNIKFIKCLFLSTDSDQKKRFYERKLQETE